MNNGDAYEKIIPERIQLLLGRIHRDESVVPSLSVPNEIMFNLLPLQIIFLRAEGNAEMSGELLEKVLWEMEREAPSEALTEPIELLIKLQLVNDVFDLWMSIKLPDHEQEENCVSSGVAIAPSDALNVPIKEDCANCAEIAPDKEIIRASGKVGKEVSARVLVRLVNEELRRLSSIGKISLETLIHTGTDCLEWTLLQESEVNEREGVLDDVEDEYEKTNADDKVRVRSVNVILDNVTALSKLLITPKEERERILQLLIVKVEDSSISNVQLRFRAASDEVIVQPVICRVDCDGTETKEESDEENDFEKVNNREERMQFLLIMIIPDCDEVEVITPSTVTPAIELSSDDISVFWRVIWAERVEFNITLKTELPFRMMCVSADSSVGQGRTTELQLFESACADDA